MLMEQSQHSESAFVTLTYADEDLPAVRHEETDLWMPTLVKSHLQKWIRSVRKKATAAGLRIRYFAAGEYGTKSGRPHYHVILFGIGPTWNQDFEQSWNKGFVSSYPATAASMAYVAKYCLKGSGDPELALPTSMPHTDLKENRVTTPPFRLTSRNPAIGAAFAPSIATSIARVTDHGQLYDPSRSGPANRIRIQGTKYPLDRTMKLHLQDALVDQGVNENHVAAITNRDFGDPDGETIKKARLQHIKALTQRDSRNKL